MAEDIFATWLNNCLLSWTVLFCLKVSYLNTHWYTRRVKEVIIPNNINRDSGIEIPQAWIPTIKKYWFFFVSKLYLFKIFQIFLN